MSVTLTLTAGNLDAAQGQYDLATGSVFSQSEQLALAGSFERLRALVRQAPTLARAIRLEIEGSSARVTQAGEVVPDTEKDLYRARYLAIINTAEKELVTAGF